MEVEEAEPYHASDLPKERLWVQLHCPAFVLYRP